MCFYRDIQLEGCVVSRYPAGGVCGSQIFSWRIVRCQTGIRGQHFHCYSNQLFTSPSNLGAKLELQNLLAMLFVLQNYCPCW